jgi:hypothetical protein
LPYELDANEVIGVEVLSKINELSSKQNLDLTQCWEVLRVAFENSIHEVEENSLSWPIPERYVESAIQTIFGTKLKPVQTQLKVKIQTENLHLLFVFPLLPSVGS